MSLSRVRLRTTIGIGRKKDESEKNRSEVGERVGDVQLLLRNLERGILRGPERGKKNGEAASIDYLPVSILRGSKGRSAAMRPNLFACP